MPLVAEHTPHAGNGHSRGTTRTSDYMHWILTETRQLLVMSDVGYSETTRKNICMIDEEEGDLCKGSSPVNAGGAD